MKLSDGFYDHEKFDGLDLAAIGLWAVGLAFANRNRTDGVVRTGFVSRVATKKQVAALLDAGLWVECDDGYRIHNYLKHQNSAEDIEALSSVRKEMGKRGGTKRAANAKQIASKPPSKPQAEEEVEVENNQPPSPPSPEQRFKMAARLLAVAETERRKGHLGNPGGYLQSRINPIRLEHEPLWREILQREPATTAQQLADVIDPPTAKPLTECPDCGWDKATNPFAHAITHESWDAARRKLREVS